MCRYINYLHFKSCYFFIDILSYIFSLLLISPIIYKENKIQKVSSAKVLDVIVSDIKYTFKTILKSSYLSSFVILMFVLNLAYGYIPYILPIFKANILKSSTLLGMLKSSITIGEIIGLAFVSRMSKYVSASFKVSMICNIFIIAIIYLSKNQYVLFILFALYGFSDSLTQPLFGYTVSNLDDVNRGKLLGGIDAIILFSPSIGIYLISAISNFNVFIAGAVLSAIFLFGFFIVSLSRDMGHIVLDSKINE